MHRGRHRTCRFLRGIGERVAKAEQAVAATAPVKRNRFIQFDGAITSVNRELEARALAGVKGYITNLAACPDGTPVIAEFVIGAYHQLFEIESPSGWPKATCRPGPSTTANATRSKPTSRSCSPPWRSAAGSSTRPAGQSANSSSTARRYRTIQIQAGPHTITAADPLPDDLREALEAINGAR